MTSIIHFNSVEIFRPVNISLIMIQCLDSLSGAASLILMVYQCAVSRPVIRLWICRHERTILVVLLYNQPVIWIVLVLWCWLPKIVHMNHHAHTSVKDIAHTQKVFPCYRYLQSAYHIDLSILNLALISSDVSIIIML